MPILSLNPATGLVLRTYPTLTEEELRQSLALAAETAVRQAAAPLENRVSALRKLRALILADADELARAIATETGKPVRYALEEVQQCAEIARYYAEHTIRLLAPELIPTAQGQAYAQYSPVGVLLAVVPWSSPLWHGFQVAIPALAAGNTVLMKHAGSVPQCALHMAALVRRAGFPRGAFAALLIDDGLVETALNDDRVAAVTFTGPRAAGRALAAQAGWLLKRSALHLDGSDAFVVMPSADLEAAGAACVRALTLGTAAGRRIILHADIYKPFTDWMVNALESLRIGNPLLPETELGPMGTTAMVQTARQQVEAAVAEGGRVLTGGSRMVGGGNFFEPTLLSDVPVSAIVAQGTLAGPIAMVFRAADVEDAIALANVNPCPGAVSVWTRDPVEQHQLLRRISADVVALNTLSAGYALPSGGWGAPGCGHELGTAALREFMQVKTVWIA